MAIGKGGPGVRVSLVCKSLRPAKLSNVVLWRDGVRIAMKESGAVNIDWEYHHASGGPYDQVGMLLTPEVTSENGEHIIERDSVLHFSLPESTACIDEMMAEPMGHSKIAVQFANGDEQVVLNGADFLPQMRSGLTTSAQEIRKSVPEMILRVVHRGPSS